MAPTGAFYPNDWIGDWPNDTAALAFINAPQAWDISKGDPNIIIGVTDSYYDEDHEDMQGQYAKMATNNNPISNHGTLVASLIAAKTNNGIGIPGIGFNCRLYGGDFYRVSLHSFAMDKSVDKVRVLNARWRIVGLYRDVLYFNDQVSFNEQGSYNEIYEQGVVMVAAAGNGTNQSSPHPAERYIFPASFDHNISVSGVGYFGKNPTDSAFNAAYVHDLYAGDSTLSHQHNTRVDVCAPSVQISGHTYNPDNLSEKYEWRQAWGTSFAAPSIPLLLLSLSVPSS